MLGQPVYFLTPDVVGFEFTGRLREGVTATDLVLTVTEILRKEKVVGKFVEFFGEGTASLSVPDRATIGQHGARVRRDDGLLPGRRQDDRVLPGHRPHRRARSRPSRPTSRRRACSACRAPARSTTRKVVTPRPRHRRAEPGGPEAPAGPDRDRQRQGRSSRRCSASRRPRTASTSRPAQLLTRHHVRAEARATSDADAAKVPRTPSVAAGRAALRRGDGRQQADARRRAARGRAAQPPDAATARSATATC